MDKPIGCMIAQRLTTALSGLGIPHKQIEEIVYKEIQDIANEQLSGDWLVAPNGATWTRDKSVETEETLKAKGITNLYNPNDI